MKVGESTPVWWLYWLHIWLQFFVVGGFQNDIGAIWFYYKKIFVWNIFSFFQLAVILKSGILRLILPFEKGVTFCVRGIRLRQFGNITAERSDPRNWTCSKMEEARIYLLFALSVCRNHFGIDSFTCYGKFKLLFSIVKWA